MTYGKSIELFLVNGTADSIITAELSNWNGKAMVFHVFGGMLCRCPSVSTHICWQAFSVRATIWQSVSFGLPEWMPVSCIRH